MVSLSPVHVSAMTVLRAFEREQIGLHCLGTGEVENSNLSGSTGFFDANGGPYISEMVPAVTDVE